MILNPARGGEGLFCPWRTEKTVARGENVSICPWRQISDGVSDQKMKEMTSWMVLT